MSGVPRKESNTLKALEPPNGENLGGISDGKRTFRTGEIDSLSVVAIVTQFYLKLIARVKSQSLTIRKIIY